MRLSFEKIANDEGSRSAGGGGVPAALATSRGDFLRRESLLVKLTQSDADAFARGENFACGECAPCGAEFGCETLAQAENFLRASETCADVSAPPPVPAELPCVAHAVSAAAFFLENPREREKPAPPVSACAKLIRRSRESSVDAVLAEIFGARDAGFPVCKIKIGFGGREASGAELAFCREILSRVGKSGVKIRFDANGAFPPEALPALVSMAERFPGLDFFEQPFPPTPENDARLFALPGAELQAKFALDESVLRARAFSSHGKPFPPVATRVVSVVKPLLAGDFRRLLAWIEKPRGEAGCAGDVVISTVFENTAAGRAALFLACAKLHPSRSRAFGLG